MTLFLRTDRTAVVTAEYRQSVMMLTKILFRLRVVNEEQALNIATKFQIFKV